MNAQDERKITAGLTEPPTANVSGIVETKAGKRALELRVNIEGQDRTFLLMLDALEDRGLSDQAAAGALEEIQSRLGSIFDIQQKTAGAVADLSGWEDHLNRIVTLLEGIQSELQQQRSR